MDLKVLTSACVTIFLAEIGDKTQLAVMGGAAATQKPVEVFIGAAVGLIVATAVGVLAGQLLGNFIPAKVLRSLGGVMFIGFGLWFLTHPNG